LESDDLKEFLEDLDEDTQKQYLKYLGKIKAKTIELLLTYEDDHAASIMTTDFMTLDKKMSIKDATNKIITTSKDQDYIDHIYVINDENQWVGTIDIKDLIIARPGQYIEDIMEDEDIFIFEDDSIEKAIDMVQDYDKNAVPVLDHNHHVIGIITADDIFDELTQDYEEDYQKLALINEHTTALTSVQRSKQRLPWLLIAVFLNLVTVTILSRFEATLEAVTVLVLFQPMILGMAGNIGTQSLAVTILGIHQDDFENKRKKHVVKEISIGVFNSTILATIAFLFVYTLLSILGIQAVNPGDVAQVVALAIFLAMSISSMMGALVPLTLDRFHIDPASASGPIMTTFNDIIALVLYFGIATIMFL
jgi:magnesium transporter